MSKQDTVATTAHPRSRTRTNPGLHLFKVPETDISMTGYCMNTIQPLTTGINPLEFLVNATNDYVDLRRSYFTVELTYEFEWHTHQSPN